MASRKQKLAGITYKMKTGCGVMYITINEDNDIPVELFATMGKAGGCAASQMEAIGRLISVGLQAGADPERIVKQLTGICCHSALVIESDKIMSCADAVGRALRQYLDSKKEGKDMI